MRSGFVSIIGRPNVGKSTLLNSIIGRKLAITSSKPQTTRNVIQGIYHDEDTQIVFVDTPGIHKPVHKLGRYLNKQTYYSIQDVDIVLLVMDVTEKLGRGDLFVIDRLKEIQKPVILLLNKIDCIKKDDILVKIAEYKDLYNFVEIIPISALKEDNIEHLIEVLKQYLPDHIKYYSDDQITNVSDQFLVTETIREKVLELTEDEIPYSVTVLIDELKEEPKNVEIYASIIVDRDNLKKILIGKQGSMIKEIGTRARHDLEVLYNKKVYLELFVKVLKNWRDKEKLLDEFGFKNFE